MKKLIYGVFIFMIISGIISINYMVYQSGVSFTWSDNQNTQPIEGVSHWGKIVWYVEGSLIGLFIIYLIFILPFRLGVKKGKKLKLEIQKDLKFKKQLDLLDKEKLEMDSNKNE